MHGSQKKLTLQIAETVEVIVLGNSVVTHSLLLFQLVVSYLVSQAKLICPLLRKRQRETVMSLLFLISDTTVTVHFFYVNRYILYLDALQQSNMFYSFLLVQFHYSYASHEGIFSHSASFVRRYTSPLVHQAITIVTAIVLCQI